MRARQALIAERLAQLQQAGRDQAQADVAVMAGGEGKTALQILAGHERWAKSAAADPYIAGYDAEVRAQVASLAECEYGEREAGL